MGTLTITKAYAAGSALMESHIDNFRTGLHTLFNTDKFSSANFDAGMALTAAKFSGGALVTSDNVTKDFGTGQDASIKLDASKNFVFDTAATTTEICFYAGSTYYMEFYTDKLHLPGDIIIAGGGANRTVLQALSSYKKPVLEWASSSSVTVSNNSSSSNETVLFFPKLVAAVEENTASSQKYRKATITNVANGYGTADSGAAQGGRRSGVSLTANSWYTVYACAVRSGTDYDEDNRKFVLVFDTTLPTQANESTLNGYYGEGSWVYLGLVRYGFGANGNTGAIPKFVACRNGWVYFYESDGAGAGLTLAYSTTDSDNTASPLYTLTNGMSGNVVPSIVGHVSIHLQRQYVSDWYIKDTSGDIIWRGGWQTDDGTMPHGFVVELPFITDGSTEYKFYQERKQAGAVAKAVNLHGFCDTYMAGRKWGHGI